MSNQFINELVGYAKYKVGERKQSKYFNGIFNFKKKLEHKSNHICRHKECSGPTIDSHELSEGVFLKNISDCEHEVKRLEPHYSNNSMRYRFKDIHIRNATVFPGYCKTHDNDLFMSIEDSFSEIDLEFTHKQVARTLKKEVYLQRLHCKKLIDTLREAPLQKVQVKWQTILNRVLEVRNTINKYMRVYRIIWHAIEAQKSCIYFKQADISKSGVAFSGMYDFSENFDEFNALVFTYILPMKNHSVLLVATIDDTNAKQLVDGIFPSKSNPLSIQTQILQQRKNIFFSKEFVGNLLEDEIDRLFDNPNFVDNGIFPIIELF